MWWWSRVIEPWVWWFAFWSRRGGGAVGVVVGLPIWVGCGWFAFWSRRGGGAVGVVVGLPVD
uniref:Uncharacterized protein n=1 Tax=Fagus sylvatica TaxID=28930 RepID=A0A2N9EZA7_FAGSY